MGGPGAVDVHRCLFRRVRCRVPDREPMTVAYLAVIVVSLTAIPWAIGKIGRLP